MHQALPTLGLAHNLAAETEAAAGLVAAIAATVANDSHKTFAKVWDRKNPATKVPTNSSFIACAIVRIWKAARGSSPSWSTVAPSEVRARHARAYILM